MTESELFKARIEGDIPSWYDKEDDLDGYTTNYGGMTVIHNTEKIDFACFGLGKDYGNIPMTIRIDNEEFQVMKDRPFGNVGVAELNSPGYPYKHKELPSFDLLEVLEMLQKDTNYHYATILVKKTLVRLMLKHFKFNKEEKQALKELFKIWRKPIVSERKPIITGGK